MTVFEEEDERDHEVVWKDLVEEGDGQPIGRHDLRAYPRFGDSAVPIVPKGEGLWVPGTTDGYRDPSGNMVYLGQPAIKDGD